MLESTQDQTIDQQWLTINCRTRVANGRFTTQHFYYKNYSCICVAFPIWFSKSHIDIIQRLPHVGVVCIPSLCYGFPCFGRGSPTQRIEGSMPSRVIFAAKATTICPKRCVSESESDPTRRKVEPVGGGALGGIDTIG